MIDLGSLGGAGGIAGKHGCAVNNQGEVVGHSELLNNATFHGFLWTRRTVMQELGTLLGDYASLAVGINGGSQVVGASLDASFNPRPFLWQNGVMTDLNTRGLVSVNPAGLYLLLGDCINAAGEIVGLGVTTDGLHGFLATPNNETGTFRLHPKECRSLLLFRPTPGRCSSGDWRFGDDKRNGLALTHCAVVGSDKR